MSSEESDQYDEQLDEEMRALQMIQQQKRQPIERNVEGLNLALEKMKTNLPWKEYLDISVDLGDVPDAQDDIKRELAFYEASVKATMEGRKLLKENGIPYLRPEDYLAENLKSDKQMQMIEKKKEKIQEEKKQMIRQQIIRKKNKKRSNRKKYSRR